MLMKSLRQLPVMTYMLFTECQQNVLSWYMYLLCSQRENRHLGNVVLNTFHFYSRWKRWIYELGFLRPSNSISVIPRRWEGEHERLGLVSGRISHPAGFEPATP